MLDAGICDVDDPIFVDTEIQGMYVRPILPVKKAQASTGNGYHHTLVEDANPVHRESLAMRTTDSAQLITYSDLWTWIENI